MIIAKLLVDIAAMKCVRLRARYCRQLVLSDCLILVCPKDVPRVAQLIIQSLVNLCTCPSIAEVLQDTL